METFLIIDGHNLLFQMFYGMPARIVNQDGKPIQGIIGFVGALIKIIKQTNPQYVMIVFDGEHENTRNEILPEYKQNRIDYSVVAEVENPFSQLPDIYRALEFMGIRFCETTDVEADDVIAGYAHRYGDEMEVVIASWDSDFFQLISEHVSILRYRGENTVICDAEFVKGKFGVAPAVYGDFKALVGDKADNIRGAEKIGAKTAGALLHQFGGLKEIINHAETIERKAVRESIIKDKERLLANYEVIKLNRTVQIPFLLEDLHYTYNGLKTMDILQGIGVK